MKYMIMAFGFLFTSFTTPSTDCGIVAIYKAVEPSDGVLAVIGNQVEDVDYFLVPLQIDDGDYSVALTKKGDNLYKIDGKNVYIKTQFCFEFSYSQEAILIIKNGYYSVGGKVIFK